MISHYASGIKGSEKKWAQFSDQAKVDEWVSNYWADTLVISIIAIGIPMAVALYRLKNPDRTWLNIVYHATMITFTCFFIFAFNKLSWRFFSLF